MKSMTCRLSALALALSAAEGFFTPVLPPGAKAGVSNIVVMYAAASLGLPSALVIALAKATFALLTRGVIAFGMSAAGGVLSALTLFFLFTYYTGVHLIVCALIVCAPMLFFLKELKKAKSIQDYGFLSELLRMIFVSGLFMIINIY